MPVRELNIGPQLRMMPPGRRTIAIMNQAANTWLELFDINIPTYGDPGTHIPLAEGNRPQEAQEDSVRADTAKLSGTDLD